MAITARVSTGGAVGAVSIRQQTRSVIASQNFTPNPNVALDEVNGVSTTGAQNGYALVFNSTTNVWEPRPVEATTIAQLTGGTF